MIRIYKFLEVFYRSIICPSVASISPSSRGPPSSYCEEIGAASYVEAVPDRMMACYDGRGKASLDLYAPQSGTGKRGEGLYESQMYCNVAREELRIGIRTGVNQEQMRRLEELAPEQVNMVPPPYAEPERVPARAVSSSVEKGDGRGVEVVLSQRDRRALDEQRAQIADRELAAAREQRPGDQVEDRKGEKENVGPELAAGRVGLGGRGAQVHNRLITPSGDGGRSSSPGAGSDVGVVSSAWVDQGSAWVWWALGGIASCCSCCCGKFD